MNLTIEEKIMLIDICNLVRSQLYTILRECYRTKNKDQEHYNTVRRQIELIESFAHRKYYIFNNLKEEYNRFKSLNQTNKYNNLLSMIKIMKRLGVQPHIEVDLSEDFDFESIWDIINQEERLQMNDDDYLEIKTLIYECNEIIEEKNPSANLENLVRLI